MGPISFTQTHLPLYSPDGKWISYVSTRTGDPELFLHSLGDGREIQLTRMGAPHGGRSGDQLVFVGADSRSIAVANGFSGNFDIYVVGVPSGAVTRLTHDPRHEVFPSWTPDGKRILFVQLDDRWVDHEVFIIDADGHGTPRSVVKDTNFFDYGAGPTFGYAVVSPDGSRLLIRSHRSGWINYWVLPVSGGTPRQIAPEPANQSDAHWSPDGKSILYLSLSNGTQDLRVVSAAGGTPRVVVKPADMGLVGAAAWSPDGSRDQLHTGYAHRTGRSVRRPVRGRDTDPSHDVRRAGVHRARAHSPEKSDLPIRQWADDPRVSLRSDLEAGGEGAGDHVHPRWTDRAVQRHLQAQAQFFAMHGYAVLTPNIRGSSGYGRAFEDANHGCWGRCDLKDVLAGVQYLRQQPYIDPRTWGSWARATADSCRWQPLRLPPASSRPRPPRSGFGDRLHMADKSELRHIMQMAYQMGPMPQSADLVSLDLADLLRRQYPDPDVPHRRGRFARLTALRRHARIRRPLGDAIQAL